MRSKALFTSIHIPSLWIKIPSWDKSDNFLKRSSLSLNAISVLLLCVISFAKAAAPRITSYNVCYTKLLRSINNLIDVLRDIDNVSLISYAESPKILIQGIPGNQKTTLTNQINGLEAKGITRGVKGLHKAYELAQQKKVLQGIV